MMNGGTVIEVADIPSMASVVFVDCAYRPRGHKQLDTCAILLQRCEDSERVKIGDYLWWQGDIAMWTPIENVDNRLGIAGIDFDIRIPRVGCSGIEHPSRMKSDS
jgi:hypothetical protein